MKKTNLLVIGLSALAITGCKSIVENFDIFNFLSENNYDVDPVTSITEDNSSPNSYNSIIDNTSIQDIFNSEEEETPDKPDDETIFNAEEGEIKQDGGSYYLKGEYKDLMITAKKGTELYVYLDGVTITSTKGIAFGSEKQITLHLILMNNSVNTISNDYVVSDTLTDQNAFHVKGDVNISGSGTLNVTSSVKSALKVSKNLVVCEGVTINATGANHAITSQSFASQGATLNLNSKDKDGINTECDGELSTFSTEQGYVYLDNTNVTIDSYGDGIQAATYIYVSGGTMNITTHGEFVVYSSSLVSSGEYTNDDFKFKKSGSDYIRVGSDEIRSLTGMYALTNSVKGLKVAGVEYEDASGNVKEVTTGDYLISLCHLANVTINSTDDCVHTNYGDVSVDSSNVTLTTKDDGLHGDYDVNINNAAITVNDSFEGIEGCNVIVDGENTNIVVTSQDDGINAASDYGSNHNVKINNGYLRIYASGDGLDANTALYLNGGTVIVEGPGSNNGSLDADKVYFNGGTVFACSTNGMLESMSATQATFVYGGSSIATNSSISICDSSNNALFTYTLKQSCSQIIFSSAKMSVGNSYKIVKGTTTVTTISLTSTLTKVGTSGGGGGPGGGGPGGR